MFSLVAWKLYGSERFLVVLGAGECSHWWTGYEEGGFITICMISDWALFLLDRPLVVNSHYFLLLKNKVPATYKGTGTEGPVWGGGEIRPLLLCTLHSTQAACTVLGFVEIFRESRLPRITVNTTVQRLVFRVY